MSATAIPAGSLVVVTGANGYIASHIIDQLLSANYKVRGTVRSLSKSNWLIPFFNQKYGDATTGDKLSLVEVPDMAAPDAFASAVQGAAGLIHVAAPISGDREVGIQQGVNGMHNVLEAAASEPSVKRVVITSSSMAATTPRPNEVFELNSSTWNYDVVEKAAAPAPDGDLSPLERMQRNMYAYGASKTKAEKAAWEFMEERKPHFVLNSVLPNANFGPILVPDSQGFPSTMLWLKMLWDGQAVVANISPQWFVDVRDDARLHLAALLYDDVSGERLFGFASPYNFNDILALFRKFVPGRKFLDDFPDLGRDLSVPDNQRAEELLKRVGGKGWTSLEETIKDVADEWK